MALTLVTTVAAATSNSYATLSYADAYWDGHYDTAKAAKWTALSDAQKTTLLIHACRVLETIRCTEPVRLEGAYSPVFDHRSGQVLDIDEQQRPIKYYYYQALQFPRNLDRDTTTGTPYIPEAVLMAQCEQAVYLLSYDESSVATRLQGVDSDSVSVGQIHIRQEYITGGSSLAPMAMEHLRPFMLAKSSRLRRG